MFGFIELQFPNRNLFLPKHPSQLKYPMSYARIKGWEIPSGAVKLQIQICCERIKHPLFDKIVNKLQSNLVFIFLH